MTIFKLINPSNPTQSAPHQDVVNILTQNHQKDIQWTTQFQTSEKIQIWKLPWTVLALPKRQSTTSLSWELQSPKLNGTMLLKTPLTISSQLLMVMLSTPTSIFLMLKIDLVIKWSKLALHLTQSAHPPDAQNTSTQRKRRDTQWTTQFQTSDKTKVFWMLTNPSNKLKSKLALSGSGLTPSQEKSLSTTLEDLSILIFKLPFRTWMIKNLHMVIGQFQRLFNLKLTWHLTQFAHQLDAQNTSTQRKRRDIQWTTQFQTLDKTKEFWTLTNPSNKQKNIPASSGSGLTLSQEKSPSTTPVDPSILISKHPFRTWMIKNQLTVIGQFQRLFNLRPKCHQTQFSHPLGSQKDTWRNKLPQRSSSIETLGLMVLTPISLKPTRAMILHQEHSKPEPKQPTGAGTSSKIELWVKKKFIKVKIERWNRKMPHLSLAFDK